jgi:hypothetical protein
MNNLLLTKNIVAYYKGSLTFSIIGSKLFLHGGAAYDEQGMLLILPKSSYCILKDIELSSFENQQKYYFYLSSKEDFVKSNLDHFIVYQEVEPKIYFFMSSQKYEENILLGEVDIDYDIGNENGMTSIAIAHNAFRAFKNEIDIRNTQKYYFLPSPINDSQKKKISKILFDFSQSLYHKMIRIDYIGLSVLCQSFLQLSHQVRESGLSPEELYHRLESNIKIFSWLDLTKFSKDEEDYIYDMKEIFNKSRAFKTSFYHIDIDDEESFFYQVLKKIKEFTLILQQVKVEKNKEKISTPYISEDFSIEPFIAENVTVVEEPQYDEIEDSTILLGTKKENFVQVGRGSQSGNDIVVGEDDKTVSRIHLKISVHKQGFFLEDMSSMGTYVDGERIEKNIKKFVTTKNKVVLGKKNCSLDLLDYRIQALLEK